MTERYLVTGGAGFIGANIAAALSKQPGADVVVVDDFSSGDWRNLIHVDCEVRAADCDDPTLLKEIAAGEYAAVFHEAAITDTTIMDQRYMVEVNTNAFADLLKASSQSGSTRVIYASSAGTYGNSPAPNRVGSGEEPANIYGFSKLAMDRVAKRWYDKHAAPIIGLRYFNVYGPGEGHKDKTASMILQLYQQIKAGKRPRLFKHGEQRRDFVYIRDVVDANLAALQAVRSGVCNVGSGQSRCFNDIIECLGKALNQTLDVEYFDNPFDFYQNHTEADINATVELLGWTPEWHLEEGVAEYVRLLEAGHNGPLEVEA
jgi:ADP-L-glycero-D-manno-heptose 6-epimerase